MRVNCQKWGERIHSKGNKASASVRALEVCSLSSRCKNLIKLHNLSCFVLANESCIFT